LARMPAEAFHSLIETQGGSSPVFTTQVPRCPQALTAKEGTARIDRFQGEDSDKDDLGFQGL
jgi:hypothetical protein